MNTVRLTMQAFKGTMKDMYTDQEYSAECHNAFSRLRWKSFGIALTGLVGGNDGKIFEENEEHYSDRHSSNEVSQGSIGRR